MALNEVLESLCAGFAVSIQFGNHMHTKPTFWYDISGFEYGTVLNLKTLNSLRYYNDALTANINSWQTLNASAQASALFQARANHWRQLYFT